MTQTLKFAMIIFTCLLVSCANRVSDQYLIHYLQIKITFNGSLTSNAQQASNYILVLSDQADINVPEVNEYLFTPGKAYDEFSLTLQAKTETPLSTYYNDYFQSWAGYIYLSKNTVEYIHHAPKFPATADTNTHHQFLPSLSFDPVTYQISNKTLTLTIDSSQLNIDQDETVYLKLLSVRRDNINQSESGILIKRTEESISIKNRLHESIEGSDFSVDNINGYEDFISWDIQII